jgi:GT2 family glycosyltransferase
MKVAVLTLCRDRLSYTQHCFGSLRDKAGCGFDHYVLDQGSQDGTPDWLRQELFEGRLERILLMEENIGLSRGHNRLLDLLDDDYDAVCTFDNDCEVVMPGTLLACAEIAARGRWVVSPRVEGLNNPPAIGATETVNGEPVGLYPAVGGIFRVMPGEFARSFRFNEANPLWGGDEGDVGRALRARGMQSGYLLDWHVNHYLTTSGQHADIPDYFLRTLAEGKPSL